MNRHSFSIFMYPPIIRLLPTRSLLQLLPPIFTQKKSSWKFYQVKFDQSRCDKPVHVKTGNAVDILRTNTFYGRYIVDSCQLIRDGQAYLAVHFRNYDRQGFTSTINPRHPSFILEIPQSFCQTSMMQHLLPWPTVIPRPILTNAQLLELFLKTE